MIRDRSVSLDPVRDAVVGVIGYGNQGRAQALNLRDSGLAVRVGLRPDGASRARAREDGFEVGEIAGVVAASDLVMLLVPDEVIPELCRDLIGPNLRDGGTVGLAHGLALAFRPIDLPPGADAILVAPTGPGIELRDRFVAGSGIPALIAVHQDASGGARDMALAYAKAIGCTRAGVLETTVRDETIVDLFGEQAVLCGGLGELVAKGFETLVESGYSPRLAYLECVQQIRLTADLITRFGVEGMWERISATARFGGLERGPQVVGEYSREAMRETLRRIESGDFYTAFMEDADRGGVELARMRERSRRELMELASRAVGPDAPEGVEPETRAPDPE